MTTPDYAIAIARVHALVDRRALAVRLELALMYRHAMIDVLGARSAAQRRRWAKRGR